MQGISPVAVSKGEKSAAERFFVQVSEDYCPEKLRKIIHEDFHKAGRGTIPARRP
jgi:hypothetical protein